MPHLENLNIGLPLAKYRDSVIVLRDGLLIETIINRVVSVLDNEGVLQWLYYDTDEVGIGAAIIGADILMNLTTERNFIEERTPEAGLVQGGNVFEVDGLTLAESEEDAMSFVEVNKE